MVNLRKAAEMALEVFEHLSKGESPSITKGELVYEIAALRQALAQPEQEPVAWVDITDEGKWSVRFAVPALSLPDGTKFYTAPPKREWVGLTDEEIQLERHKLDPTAGWTYDHFARAIEAKLKEKNT